MPMWLGLTPPVASSVREGLMAMLCIPQFSGVEVAVASPWSRGMLTRIFFSRWYTKSWEEKREGIWPRQCRGERWGIQ